MDERDLWWEARQRTAAYRQPVNIFRYITQSLPGQPTRTVYAALGLGREKCALAIDLNHYRPGRNLKAYYDAGVDAFILRMGGPVRWVSGDWRYTLDNTFRPYMEQLDKLSLLHRTIGYIIHNPFELYTQNGATGETIHTELIDEWTSGGYLPQALCYDHEVAKAWQNNVEITCTNYNLVKSLDVNTDNTYKKFRRMVGVYTAKWFTNSHAPTEHTTWFDNINKPESAGGAGMQRPGWLAWYAQNMSASYTDLQQSLVDLLTPTPEQKAKLLTIGSNSPATLWQFTDRLKLAPDTQGVDASVSMGTLEEFCAAWGLPASPTLPEQPDEPETPGTGDTTLAGRVAALETALSAVQGQLRTHVHKTGAPEA